MIDQFIAADPTGRGLDADYVKLIHTGGSK
jgi:hypothetical protein